jgi:hypothetical protein
VLGSDIRRMFRATQRDDWESVRTLAAGRQRRRTAVIENLAGTAEMIVGTIPGARSFLEAGVAQGRNPDADHQYVRACARQLVSVERLAGDLPAARRRLADLRPSSPLEAAYGAVQAALVELADGRPDEARRALEADGVPTRAISRAMRHSLSIDAAVALIVLANARRRLGEVDAAQAALTTAATMLDDRPYARGELLLAEGWLACDLGRRPEAEVCAAGSLERFERVGATVDAARARLLVGVLRAEPSELQLAEQAFRERGALGHLPEVDAARRHLGP